VKPWDAREHAPGAAVNAPSLGVRREEVATSTSTTSGGIITVCELASSGGHEAAQTEPYAPLSLRCFS